MTYSSNHRLYFSILVIEINLNLIAAKFANSTCHHFHKLWNEKRSFSTKIYLLFSRNIPLFDNKFWRNISKITIKINRARSIFIDFFNYSVDLITGQFGVKLFKNLFQWWYRYVSISCINLPHFYYYFISTLLPK